MICECKCTNRREVLDFCFNPECIIFDNGRIKYRCRNYKSPCRYCGGNPLLTPEEIESGKCVKCSAISCSETERKENE